MDEGRPRQSGQPSQRLARFKAERDLVASLIEDAKTIEELRIALRLMFKRVYNLGGK